MSGGIRRLWWPLQLLLKRLCVPYYQVPCYDPWSIYCIYSLTSMYSYLQCQRAQICPFLDHSKKVLSLVTFNEPQIIDFPLKSFLFPLKAIHFISRESILMLIINHVHQLLLWGAIIIYHRCCGKWFVVPIEFHVAFMISNRVYD